MFQAEDYPRLLDQYQAMLHRILWDLHIYPYDDYYDDCYQQSQINLYRCAQDFDGDALSDEDNYRFTAYAMNLIRWRLLDFLRQHSRRKQREEVVDQVFDVLTYDAVAESGLMSRVFMAKAKKILSDQDYAFLMDVILHRGDSHYFTDKYQVTRQAIHGRKRRLAKKLAALKPLLWKGDRNENN
ncbi:sigma factor [Aerococcus kribbianus]|uniref:Sigma factor n=1 Tax=Aerococcus kribbianus TaxID=2999064 RepID=A0A9X3JEH9_9LACT|nr:MULTISPECIES: sigma factor [unclassified Aerococcus]MCZ0717169.1 sigma factor [Aerococcus sp. YH-aer221]MCZ0725457.1 sigma factor [Aerococcus sp. YH-aer222]